MMNLNSPSPYQGEGWGGVRPREKNTDLPSFPSLVRRGGINYKKIFFTKNL